jgi:hypothetical protein
MSLTQKYMLSGLPQTIVKYTREDLFLDSTGIIWNSFLFGNRQIVIYAFK